MENNGTRPADESVETTPAESTEEIEAIEAGDKPCSQCEATTSIDDGVTTENAFFCAACYENLKQAIADNLAQQSVAINYTGALLGGLVGGLVGSIAWWGFTVVSGWEVGLIAILIGVAVGKGIVIASGGKRAQTLQIMAVVITAVSYFLAKYWTTRTLVLREDASGVAAKFFPVIPSPAKLIEVTQLTFEAFTLLFLAIALWQAWKITAPVKLTQ